MKLPSHNAAIKERQRANREKREARHRRITLSRLKRIPEVAESMEKHAPDLKSQSKTLEKLLKENKIGQGS